MKRGPAIAGSAVVALTGACHNTDEGAEMGKAISAAMETQTDPMIYKELTPAILASIPDNIVEQAIVDFVAAKAAADPEHRREIVAKLPVGAQATYITVGLEREIRAGGFDRYYSSDAGQFADQAAEAFEFFSAHEHAALMREANSVRAMDAERRKQGGSGAKSQLAPLDAQYRALKEDMSALRIAKIRAMPGFFSGK